ncbi:MAG: exodeoxyribonuclease VII small subunit [Candidatus Omnitrophota bacterium]
MPDIKYSKAVAKLEEIIQKIESEEIDIDELSEKVKEAAGLVKLCRDKISKAEFEVREIVDKFDAPAAQGGL